MKTKRSFVFFVMLSFCLASLHARWPWGKKEPAYQQCETDHDQAISEEEVVPLLPTEKTFTDVRDFEIFALGHEAYAVETLILKFNASWIPGFPRPEKLTYEQAVAIADKLSRFSCVKKLTLNISWNELGGNSIELLVRAIAELPNLSWFWLNLRGNNLNDEDASMLTTHLKALKDLPIEYLCVDVQMNTIGATGEGEILALQNDFPHLSINETLIILSPPHILF